MTETPCEMLDVDGTPIPATIRLKIEPDTRTLIQIVPVDEDDLRRVGVFSFIVDTTPSLADAARVGDAADLQESRR